MAPGDVLSLVAHQSQSSEEDATCASTTADTQRHYSAAISAVDLLAKEASQARKTEHAMRLSMILRSFASGTAAVESLAEWTIW